MLVKQEETALTEENAETEETEETEVIDGIDLIDLKEVEAHHHQTSASSAEELATGLENVQKEEAMTEAEVEAEQAAERADLDQETETLTSERVDASLVEAKDILQETAEVIEAEMIQEIEEVEVDTTKEMIEEEIPESDFLSHLPQATQSHGLKVKSNVTETSDWIELNKEPEKNPEEVVEEEEDLHPTADLAHSTVELILMTTETEEEAVEEVEEAVETETLKEEEEEAEPLIASEREAKEATLNTPSHFPTDQDILKARATKDLQEEKSTETSNKEVSDLNQMIEPDLNQMTEPEITPTIERIEDSMANQMARSLTDSQDLDLRVETSIKKSNQSPQWHKTSKTLKHKTETLNQRRLNKKLKNDFLHFCQS